MEKPPLAVFTKEFKEEAVKMVMEEGLSIGEVSRRLSIPKSTLDYWVKKAREGKLLDNSYKKHKPVTPEEMELARLRRENAELKLEREILKKAYGYLYKGSRLRSMPL